MLCLDGAMSLGKIRELKDGEPKRDADCREEADYHTKPLNRVHGPHYIVGVLPRTVFVFGAPFSH